MRKHNKQAFVNEMNSRLMLLFEKKDRHNNSMVELSKTQYNRFKDNAIHFAKMRRKGKEIFMI